MPLRLRLALWYGALTGLVVLLVSLPSGGTQVGASDCMTVSQHARIGSPGSEMLGHLSTAGASGYDALSRAGASMVIADLAALAFEPAGPGRSRLVLRTGSVAATAPASALEAMEGWTCYTGLEARDGVLWLNPQLPSELGSIELEVLYRGYWLSLDMTDRRVRISAAPCSARPIRVGVGAHIVEVLPGQTHELKLPVKDSAGWDAADSPRAVAVPRVGRGREVERLGTS